MQLVIDSNGILAATHADFQEITGLYPACLVLSVPDSTAVEIGQAWAVSLADAQAARIAQAKAAADAVLAPLATRFSDYERQTWGAQLAEAQAILADPALAADKYPTIAGIVAVTGESVADFAAAVLKNNEDWTRVTANVIGQRQALCAGVKACATLEEVLAFPVAVALPA
jgi:hypothetical protein